MSSNRLVKWSKEAQSFFDKAVDNSVVLDLVISYACASQTGEGFEELVNTINSESIKRKVKKVIITDTSYLYRYSIPEFQKYSDQNIPTEWYLKNKESIENLTVPRELKSWAEGLNSSEFVSWMEKLELDFYSVQRFRNLIVQDSKNAADKNGFNPTICMNFILEESVYVCTNMKNSVIVYPVFFTPSFQWITKKYTNIKQLCYKISRQAQHNLRCFQPYNRSKLDENKLNKEMLSFIKYAISNVNFYVIDKEGNYVYRNEDFLKVTGEISNAKNLDKNSWNICVEVMKENKQKVIEEEFKNISYLSFKSPLVIDGKIEGILGFAIDITDRKKAEKLKIDLKIQRELYEIAKRVAHDICSPISALEMVKHMSIDKLGKQEREMFEMAIKSIRDISDTLIKRYRKEEIDKGKEEYIGLYNDLKDIIKAKRYQYIDRKGISINFHADEENKFAFIRGNNLDFSRMMSNLINNAVKAIEKVKEGIIEVSYKVTGEEVEIRIKDNGEGMPKGMIDKINRGIAVGTTKEEGHGIGMEQILSTVEEMKGKIEVNSIQFKETEFVLKFTKYEKL